MPDDDQAKTGKPPPDVEAYFPPLSDTDRSPPISVRDRFPDLSARPSYLEWSGTRQMSGVLIIICVVAVGLLITWGSTRPTAAEAKGFAGAAAKPEETLGVLIQLRDEHFENFRDMFQLIVLSGLVPLFTLLAGYVFGKRPEKRADDAHTSRGGDDDP
jgi:hypothetical protein